MGSAFSKFNSHTTLRQDKSGCLVRHALACKQARGFLSSLERGQQGFSLPIVDKTNHFAEPGTWRLALRFQPTIPLHL
ncbi:hypothetical protein MXB_289 [Myxobolus squamalis]|nr:hypothetical protein MXB_289 [Myxobolus squamalis]